MSSKDLAKNQELAERQAEIQKANSRIVALDIKVGDMFLSERFDECRVKAIKDGKVVLEHMCDVHHGDKIVYEWSKYGEVNVKEFEQLRYVKLDKSYEETKKEVLAQIATGEYIEKEEQQGDPNSTALTTASSKENLITARKAIQQKAARFEIARRVLEDLSRALRHTVQIYQDKVKYITKIIGVIESYLGVKEEIVQIRSGDIADVSVPLYIRQQLLFMDEEVGIVKDEGLDFRSIEEFDNWVRQEGNLQRILPEKKGVVALRVRREKKDYGNPILTALDNEDNMKTYLLIRNGDNLYRIWSNINIHPRMFPTKDEFEALYKLGEHSWDNKEKEERRFQYKKHALLLQGLIERTMILHPLKHQVNMLDLATHGDAIVFIHDDEALLPTGRLPWREWQTQINRKIKAGSRILFFGGLHYDKDYMKGRVPYGYEQYRPPSPGIYTAISTTFDCIKRCKEEDKEVRKNEAIRFLYKPSDTVYVSHSYHRDDCGFHERKKRIGFEYYNNEVLNYDQIDLQDMEFYLECRTERCHYLKMLPLLREAKKWKLEEIEREKEFVKLVVGRMKVEESKVWDTIIWWKLKNKWKRGIDSDDAKALRMIERRLRKVL